MFYLQAEIQYHYLRERLQAIRLDPAVIAAARDNLVATPKLRMLLDERGVALVTAAIATSLPRQRRRTSSVSTRSAICSMAAPMAAARTTTPP